MANRLYNKQVSPKGYMKGGRVNKMGGGMMKRDMYSKGSKGKKMIGDLDKDGKMSAYEKKRDMAIKKSMAKQKMKNKKKAIG